MKAIRSKLLFGICLICLGACLNEPEFDNSPQITFNSISFVKGSVGIRDSLIVTVNFRDGDGDLGLESNLLDSPYHQLNFYANDNRELFPIQSILIDDFRGYRYHNSKKTPKRPSYLMRPPAKRLGEMITLQSRNEGFSLPPFEEPFDCPANDESYLNENLNPDTIYIFRNFKYLIKDKTTIVDSLERIDNPNEYYYVVVNHFYIQANPAHNNIKVQFFIKNTDGSYTEYDWRKEPSCSTFDGRFPTLADRDRPLEGELTYSMTSVGFLTTFGSRTLKLSITIYDRLLHSSNTIDTEDFRLDEI